MKGIEVVLCVEGDVNKEKKDDFGGLKDWVDDANDSVRDEEHEAVEAIDDLDDNKEGSNQSDKDETIDG